MFNLQAVQTALREEHVDGWLLYDFRGLNVLARRVAQLPEGGMLSRRWFYFVPAQGEPRKLVHRIESGALDHLPGSKTVYLRWQELEAGVATLVRGARRVAMEYVPRNANPYVSRVDAGTVELVRGCGTEVVPSGDLIQRFEACWDDEQWAMHQEAARHTRSAFDAAFGFIVRQIRAGTPPRETEVVRVILDHFKANHVVCDHPPICAVGPNSGNPHYEPIAGQDAVVNEGSFVLIDLWAKCDRPRLFASTRTERHVEFRSWRDAGITWSIVRGDDVVRTRTASSSRRLALASSSSRLARLAAPEATSPARNKHSSTRPARQRPGR